MALYPRKWKITLIIDFFFFLILTKELNSHGIIFHAWIQNSKEVFEGLDKTKATEFSTAALWP